MSLSVTDGVLFGCVRHRHFIGHGHFVMHRHLVVMMVMAMMFRHMMMAVMVMMVAMHLRCGLYGTRLGQFGLSEYGCCDDTE